ncbi:MAG: hypothetical protein QS721_06375 [Candidatus Endonucleobacter sp. (ex Gigantidas childressi)]|nr:hypothetical protein [Candidatus Endonucleobacter sp. (ex Gigantidas childressi)]
MISDKIVKILADVGFMASNCGYSKYAFAIFNGIETVRPDSVLPDIGYALEFINKKKYQEAIRILRKQGLKKDSENTAVKAFIGMALMLDGHNKESEECLGEIENCEDSVSATMAKELLEDIRSN